MRLVVEHEDVLHAHQLGHHALEHLAFGFQRLQLVAVRPWSSARPPVGQLEPLAELEGVVVGDDDLGPVRCRRACRSGPARGCA